MMPMDYSPERWLEGDKPAPTPSSVWHRGMSDAPIPTTANSTVVVPRDGYQIQREAELEQMRQAIAKMGLKP